MTRLFVHDMKNYLGVILGYSNLLLEELPPEDPRRTDVDAIRKAGEAAIALVEKWRAADPEPNTR
jgi:two-component system cell cycle sensor histidine kinase/response regulator CckA